MSNSINYDDLIKIYARVFKGVKEYTGYEYRLDHGVRVFNYCKHFCEMDFLKNKNINKDALLIAALFHDIGKIHKVNDIKYMEGYDDEKFKHDEVGEKIIADYLGKYVGNNDLIKKISRIIGGHHGNNLTEFESYVIWDADKLDNSGLMLLIRLIAFNEHKERNLKGMFEYWNKKGRSNAISQLNEYHFEKIGILATSRFKKLDRLMKDLFYECQTSDIKTKI